VYVHINKFNKNYFQKIAKQENKTLLYRRKEIKQLSAVESADQK